MVTAMSRVRPNEAMLLKTWVESSRCWRTSISSISIKTGGDLVHDLAGRFVLDEQFAIAFESTFAHLVDAGFEIESELHIGVKEISIDGLGDGPVLEFLHEEQAGDGIEFLGGPAHDGVKMFGQLFGRHEFQQSAAKDALPTGANTFHPQRRDEAVEGVEKPALLRIDDSGACYP